MGAELGELAAAGLGGGLSLQLLLMALRRGQAAEAKLEERVEGGLSDHKAKLEAIPEQLGGLKVGLARAEERSWLPVAAVVGFLVGVVLARRGSR